ncbi:MAG: pyridoxal-dependent decarboxylase [Nitriliruptoraceae bacterium]
MAKTPLEDVLDALSDPVHAYLASLPDRRVWSSASPEEVRAVLDRPLPEETSDAVEVVTDLARELEPYVTAHASGRYFGFVIGGLHPAAYGAELLTSTWDQNAGLYSVTPGVVIAEEVAARWLLELLGFPDDAAAGFVTGGQMATFTCLAAARDHVLRAVEWDVEADGLHGAPRVNVVLKSGVHATVPRALRFLGLGERAVTEVGCDDQDRIVVAQLAETLDALAGPTIVCVEAGNVNTGAFDDFRGVADVIDAHRARGNPTWVHVDGAVGLLAAAAPSQAALTAGLHRMDSWSTDGHKLLNVAYDCGIAITRHTDAHRAAMSVHATYLVQDEDRVREPMDWNPEFSRRARGVGVYATLRALGRRGVVDLVERTTGLARRFAEQLSDSGRATVVNDVAFNQVLVRWNPPAGWASDAWNDEVIARVQRDGTAFFSGTTWRGERMMRISVSDHATDEDDVDQAVAALLRGAETG